jgi:hypothetical protein
MSPSLGVADVGERRSVVRHHCEGLVLAVLARAQPPDRILVRRVAREVIATKPFDGEDRPIAEQGHRLLERERQPGTAD